MGINFVIGGRENNLYSFNFPYICRETNQIIYDSQLFRTAT